VGGRRIRESLRRDGNVGRSKVYRAKSNPAREQDDIEYRHRQGARPDDSVPVEAKGPEHGQYEEMHRDSRNKRNPPKSARQKPERECDLDEGSRYPEPMKRRSSSRNGIGDRRDNSGKVIPEKVRVDLLQSGEEVCSGHDQASDVERTVAAGKVLLLPRI